MTRINVLKFKNAYRLEVLGHSGYAKKGYDIVCSSISTLTTFVLNLFNILGEDVNVEKYEDGALISVVYTKNVEVFDTFISTIEELEQQYPQNVHLIVETFDKDYAQ